MNEPRPAVIVIAVVVVVAAAGAVLGHLKAKPVCQKKLETRARNEPKLVSYESVLLVSVY